MICKFCLNEKKLIKAHIIPAGFFRRLNDGEIGPKLLHEKEYPKKAPLGVYDSTILCGDCEKIFGDWDAHAQEIMSLQSIGEPLAVGDKIVAHKISAFDYDKLKLFFVSLVWRASVSSHKFYSRISLGPWESVAKNMIATSDPGDDEGFATTVSRFASHPLGVAVLDPHHERFQNINYCRFYLSDYVAYIKVDKRSAPSPHAECKMKRGCPLYVVSRDLSRSKELPLIHRIAGANKR